MNHNRNEALCFFLGLVVGSVSALFLAPDSGRRTRAKLRRTGEDLYERGRDAADHAIDSSERQLRRVSEQARAGIEAVKDRLT